MAQKDSGHAIGIDLGTTYSCVGVWRSGRVEILPNELGLKKTPSYVAFPDTGRHIGEEAKSRAAFNSTNTIFNIKRLMGRRPYDCNVPVGDMIKLWPFEVISDPQVQHRYMIRVNYRGEDKLFSPEEISSMVLAKMRDIAEAYLGTTARNAVISVPACFNTAQRQATMDAGAIAGLNVMRLINEPSAAALAYGFVRDVGWEGKKNILVFDLGGGTLDVSLLNIDEGTFRVMSTEGDTCLGGEDFDNAMVNYFIEEFKEKHKRDISCSSRAVRRLKAACEKAKIALTVTKETTIEIDRLYEEIDFSSTITRSLFQKLNDRLLIKCIEIVDKCLWDGKVSSRHIDEVLLVGGSTRIPMVQEMLVRYFGMELCKAINADEAVAYGATLQAAMLTREGNEEMPKLVLEDVTALDFNIFVNSTYQKTAFPKNTAIPPVKPFIIALDQFVHFLHVYEDKDNYFLESLECNFAPNSIAYFCIDENGILSVSIRNTNTNQKHVVPVPRSRLNGDEIKRMAQEAEVYNFQKKEHNNRVKEKNSLEKYIYDSRKAINDKMIETKLDSADKKKIEVALENLMEWLATHQLVPEAEYKDKMVELQNVCGPILNKISEEAEKERSNDLSPNRGAGPSVKDGDCGSSTINWKSKANRPQSDDITESNISSKIIIHPRNDADEFDHGSPELVVDSPFLNYGTTSKIGSTFPVELTSETKLTIWKNLDTVQLPQILSAVRDWLAAVTQNICDELVRMLHAKSEHRSFSAIAGADSQYHEIKHSPPDDRSACAETTEAATDFDGGATHYMEIKRHSPGAGVGWDNHPSNRGSTDHEEKDNPCLGYGAVAKPKAEGSPPNSNTLPKGNQREVPPTTSHERKASTPLGRGAVPNSNAEGSHLNGRALSIGNLREVAPITNSGKRGSVSQGRVVVTQSTAEGFPPNSRTQSKGNLSEVPPASNHGKKVNTSLGRGTVPKSKAESSPPNSRADSKGSLRELPPATNHEKGENTSPSPRALPKAIVEVSPSNSRADSKGNLHELPPTTNPEKGENTSPGPRALPKATVEGSPPNSRADSKGNLRELPRTTNQEKWENTSPGPRALPKATAEGSPPNSRTQSKVDFRDLPPFPPNGGSSMADQVPHKSSPDANLGSSSTLSDKNPRSNPSSGNEDDVSTKEVHAPPSNTEGKPDPKSNVSSASDGQDEMARADGLPANGGFAGTAPPGQNSSA